MLPVLTAVSAAPTWAAAAMGFTVVVSSVVSSVPAVPAVPGRVMAVSVMLPPSVKHAHPSTQYPISIHAHPSTSNHGYIAPRPSP